MLLLYYSYCYFYSCSECCLRVFRTFYFWFFLPITKKRRRKLGDLQANCLISGFSRFLFELLYVELHWSDYCMRLQLKIKQIFDLVRCNKVVIALSKTLKSYNCRLVWEMILCYILWEWCYMKKYATAWHKLPPATAKILYDLSKSNIRSRRKLL